MRIAVIGTGISGLVAAHLLHAEHEITVYEAGGYAGGHTDTVRVETSGGVDDVDMGFIVFNDRNYPNFERLLAKLGVASQPSHMSFSVADGRGRCATAPAGAPSAAARSATSMRSPRRGGTGCACGPRCAGERLGDRVLVEADGCETEAFDEVVIATHSDQELRMLAAPSEAEREILGAIPYRRNEAVLHTDAAVMPRRRRAWASWNFHLSARPAAGTTVTYWMNNLQRLDADRDFFVTLNRGDIIDPAKVIRTVAYDHPVYTREGVAAQGRHTEIAA